MEKEIKNESANTLQNLSGLKLVEFGDSTGFSCDVETGFCGPIDQKKEEENK